MAHNRATPPAGPAVDARGVPTLDPTANVIALTTAGFNRQDDLRSAHGKGLRREMKLHNKYTALLAVAESARIDAIHAADDAAKAREAIVNAAQQATLAKQVTDTAEAFRVQVEAQRVATADALDSKLAPIQNSLAELQKALYAGQGEKVATVDSASLAREAAAAALAAQSGRRENYQWAIGVAVLVFVALIGFLAAHYH